MGGALQERLGAREFPRRALQCLVREVDPTGQQRADLGLSDLPEVVGDMAVYKSGDTYYGARSNEFGYANYELLAKPPEMIDPLPQAVVDKAAGKNEADFLHYNDEVN